MWRLSLNTSAHLDPIRLLPASPSVPQGRLSARVHRVRHYMFDATGVITTEDGTPLKDVEVTLRTSSLVCEGVTCFSARRIVAGDGTFAFMYLTGDPSIKYEITVRKEGFNSEIVSGSSPPAAHHTFRLRKSPYVKDPA